MKKKIYYIVYPIIQIVMSIITFIFANRLAKQQVDAVVETLAELPEEISSNFLKLFDVEQLSLSFRLCSVIAIVLGIILLILAIKNRLVEKKGLTIGLLIPSMLLVNNVLLALGAIELILIATTPVDTLPKEKKAKYKIERLEPIKLTSKDYLLGIILVILYATQFGASYVFHSSLALIIYEVFFRIAVLALALYTFNKRLKRDVSSFKKNIGAHIGYAFKWWGIMLGLSFIAAFVRILLGGNTVTANQDALNSMAIWYLIPMTIIWAPIVEEAIFRGVLRRFVKNDIAFIALSAIIFGLLHTVGSEATLYAVFVQSLQYMVMGGVFAYVYTKTNNICINMTMHAIQNSLGMIFIILMSL